MNAFGNLNPNDVKAMLENADLNKVQQKLKQLNQNDLAKMVESVGADNIRQLLNDDTRREMEQMLSARPDIRKKLEQLLRGTNLNQ